MGQDCVVCVDAVVHVTGEHLNVAGTDWEVFGSLGSFLQMFMLPSITPYFVTRSPWWQVHDDILVLTAPFPPRRAFPSKTCTPAYQLKIQIVQAGMTKYID